MGFLYGARNKVADAKSVRISACDLFPEDCCNSCHNDEAEGHDAFSDIVVENILYVVGCCTSLKKAEALSLTELMTLWKAKAAQWRVKNDK